MLASGRLASHALHTNSPRGVSLHHGCLDSSPSSTRLRACLPRAFIVRAVCLAGGTGGSAACVWRGGTAGRGGWARRGRAGPTAEARRGTPRHACSFQMGNLARNRGAARRPEARRTPSTPPTPPGRPSQAVGYISVLRGPLARSHCPARRSGFWPLVPPQVRIQGEGNRGSYPRY